MIRTALLAAASVLVLTSAAHAQDGEARAREILRTTPLIDGHNDLPWALRQDFGNDPYRVDLTANLDESTKLHTDIPRLRAGGVGAQFWSVYVPATLTPQEAVNRGLPRPSACDCVVVVLWARMGTPLPASCAWIVRA